MKYFLVLLSLVLVLVPHAQAIAGPGDPRLVNGVLEWPRTVTNEPFIVVRGDDGVLYYVGIAAARRDAALAAGARVAVLGLEGRTAHEISALGVGAGESIEAALASLQGARPAPAVAAPGVVTPPTAAGTTPASATVAAPMVPANGGAAAIAPPNGKPLVPVAPPAASVPVAPNAKSAAAPAAPAPPAPVVTSPALTSPAPAVTPPPSGVTPPSIITAPTASNVRSAAVPPPARRSIVETAPAPAAMPASASDERRWTEISGVVESLVGRTLVLRSEEGRIAVDVSSLSQNLERMVTPGSTVRVYGVPIEVRFKAMGFFDPGTRP